MTSNRQLWEEPSKYKSLCTALISHHCNLGSIHPPFFFLLFHFIWSYKFSSPSLPLLWLGRRREAGKFSLELPGITPFLLKYPAIKPLGWIPGGVEEQGRDALLWTPAHPWMVLFWDGINPSWEGMGNLPGSGEGTRSWALLRLEQTLRGLSLEFWHYPISRSDGKGPSFRTKPWEEKKRQKISISLTLIPNEL